uniref:Putative ubiquitin-associated protein 1 panstrongylus lignarius n=1 Tax=Rhodnius prolixus TaxID=13249 RepID=A0A4P6D838_RHOPR
MDGIPVKISENYKPPRKLTLPGCILNRINSEIKIEPYNFNVERSVLEHLALLKEAKRKQCEKKQCKRDDWLSKTKFKEPPENDSFSLDTSSQVPQESTMLTPVPISSNCRIEPSRQEGQINLSDFENDTSSPFDNVELKTINEMEELAHVLGGTSLKNETSLNLKNPIGGNVHLPNGYTSHHWGTTPSTYSYSGVYGSGNNVMAGGSAVTVSSPHISSGPLSYMHSTNDTLYTGSSVYTGSTALHLPHSYNMPQGSTIHRDNYNTNGMYAPTYQVHESVHKPRMISQLPPYTPSCSTASTHNTFVSSTSSHPKPHNPLQSYIPTSSSLQLLTISSPPSQVASCNLSVTRTQVLQEEKDDGGVSRILDDLRKQVLLRKYESQPRPPSPSVSSDFVKAVKASASRHNDTSSIGDALSHLSLQSQEFAKI